MLCGQYHSLNTQFRRSPSQAALLNDVRDCQCVYQKCRKLSPLSKKLDTDNFHETYSKIKVLDDLIPWFALVIPTACGPYHSLNTQFRRSPSQAVLLNDVRDCQCVYQECRKLFPAVPKNQVQKILMSLIQKIQVFGRFNSMVCVSDTNGLRAISFIEHPVPAITKSSSSVK